VVAMRTRPALVLLALVPLALAGCSTAATTTPGNELGTPASTPQPTTRTGQPSPPHQGTGTPKVVDTIATGLAAPWGITFLPDGTALVGERDTTRIVAINGHRVRTVGRVEDATPRGEAGLLGLATSPSYATDHLIYAYVSTETDNRVVRMRYDGQRLGTPHPVLTGIPNGFIHDGGRLLFDSDGNLFVSTGETGQPDLAQDPSSLAGKILHITPDGKPAPDNPKPGSPVWTMGHRNVQGLAFDDRGRLWATEFGANTWDELNLIEKGRNYGWPRVEGKGDLAEYRNPFVEWRTDQASPSGLAFLDGSLWAASLRGQRLWQIPVTKDGTGQPKDWFVGAYGRLRTVVVAPDGNLWVSTSNRDTRGDPKPGDDRILEIAVD
jgi:glucose/arabinose dehydrogenase